MKFEKKIKAGCNFFQTQAVFSVENFEKFYNYYKNYNNIKIIAGIFILKSAKVARFMNKNIPGIYIPQSIVDELENSKDPLKTGIEISARIAKGLKNKVNGLHIMAFGIEDSIPDFLKNFEKFKEEK